MEGVWVGCADSAPSVRYPARRERFYRLVNALGDACSCCGVCAGRVVDHNHFTGAVRGLLCLVCNNRVDQCIHPCSSDCRYARYLNDPPAKELELKYPVRHRRRGQTISVHRYLVSTCFAKLSGRQWILSCGSGKCQSSLDFRLRSYNCKGIDNAETHPPTRPERRRGRLTCSVLESSFPLGC